MPISTSSQHKGPGLKYSEGRCFADSILPRDRTQSRRLHEPKSMVSSIDPINGRDVAALIGRPAIIDGILTIYFESQATRMAYIAMPLNHPCKRVAIEASDLNGRGD